MQPRRGNKDGRACQTSKCEPLGGGEIYYYQIAYIGRLYLGVTVTVKWA